MTRCPSWRRRGAVDPDALATCIRHYRSAALIGLSRTA
jgi:hypothetical protein